MTQKLKGIKLRRQFIKLNSSGTLGISLPARVTRKLGWTCEDHYELKWSGNVLQVTIIPDEVDYDAV